MIPWEEDMLDKPIFPSWASDGPKVEARSPSSFGHQASDFARRAQFPDGMGLHAPRREILVKVAGKIVYP